MKWNVEKPYFGNHSPSLYFPFLSKTHVRTKYEIQTKQSPELMDRVTHPPLVNFSNILRTAFWTIFWRQKISNPKHNFVIFDDKISAKNAHIKCWWNWHLPSISSTFYVRIFRTNVVLAPYNVTRENNVRTKTARV